MPFSIFSLLCFLLSVQLVKEKKILSLMIISFIGCSQIFRRLCDKLPLFLPKPPIFKWFQMLSGRVGRHWVEAWSWGDSLSTWWFCPESRLYFPIQTTLTRWPSLLVILFHSNHTFITALDFLFIVDRSCFLLFLKMFILFFPREVFKFSFFRAWFHKFHKFSMSQLSHHKRASVTKWSVHETVC